mmetsp:Transcript_44488/g.123101  ORF Transcript_44488/g.123101 Transcript_44488/m.123101 type:complete len:539 (+) Transcript_44488:75-1691(+)
MASGRSRCTRVVCYLLTACVLSPSTLLAYQTFLGWDRRIDWTVLGPSVEEHASEGSEWSHGSIATNTPAHGINNYNTADQTDYNHHHPPTTATSPPPTTTRHPALLPGSRRSCGAAPRMSCANALTDMPLPPCSIDPGCSVGGPSLPRATQETLAKHGQTNIADVVVASVWPAPHWFHVVSSSQPDHPTREVREKKLWECPLTFLNQWALAACTESSSLMVDVGMNIGWFTLLAAASGRQVVAFEPNPIPRQYAEASVAINGWGDRVKVFPGGVSSDGEKLRLSFVAGYWGQGAAKRTGDGVRVASYMLDDVVEDRGVCVLKVDCQGCEPDAFLSAKKMLAGGRVENVQLEYSHDKPSRKSLELFFNLSAGRRWHCIILPVALFCEGSALADIEESKREHIWDFVVGGVIDNCQAWKVEEMGRHGVPPGYYSDLWILGDDMLAHLRAQPGFGKALGRVATARGARCKYSEAQRDVFVDTCVLLCRSFPTLAEASRACDARPTCLAVLRWDSKYELRGGSQRSKRPGVVAYFKQGCQAE